jgi:RNA polymerase sigma factor (sigma-70 family)
LIFSAGIVATPTTPPVCTTNGVETLYVDHHGWLKGWLRKKLGNAADAADLAQDTFMRILVAQDNSRDLREPRAYLTTVASRVLLNHYRRLSLERAYLDALALIPEAHAPAPEERLIILETLHEIDAMLDALPPKVRTTFLLAQFEGLTYAQIAEQCNINLRTVKRHMALAFEECMMLML